jgi:NAD(P)-dependent dehydrogenase (short-subunit alcohol dehydrogenase family)
VYAFQADVTDKASIDSTFEKVASEIGKIDVYIANAGYLASPGSAATASIEDFATSFAINVTGQLIAAQAFLKHRAEKATHRYQHRRRAHVLYGPDARLRNFKAAAARLFDMIAAENPDVRVFNLHPGLIKSAMSEKAGMHGIADDTPELPAAAAVYLSSPDGEFLRGRFCGATGTSRSSRPCRRRSRRR